MEQGLAWTAARMADGVRCAHPRAYAQRRGVALLAVALAALLLEASGAQAQSLQWDSPWDASASPSLNGPQPRSYAQLARKWSPRKSGSSACIVCWRSLPRLP